MKLTNLTKSVGSAILGLVMLMAITVMAGSTAQAQWPSDRDYGRNRNDRYRRGGGYRMFEVAREHGYQDGQSTGQNDSQRGQSFNPQRSHYYRSATDGYEGYFGNKEAYKQAYREAFQRGYEDGFRRYRGNNRGNGGWRNGRWFPW